MHLSKQWLHKVQRSLIQSLMGAQSLKNQLFGKISVYHCLDIFSILLPFKEPSICNFGIHETTSQVLFVVLNTLGEFDLPSVDDLLDYHNFE